MRTSNSAIRCSAFSRHRGEVERRPGRKGASYVQVQHEVLGDGKSATTPSASGPPARTRRPRRGRRGPRPTSSTPSSRTTRAPARLQAEDRLGELGLAVALHARDGDDLAARDVERHVVDLAAPRRRRSPSGRGPARRLAGLGRAPCPRRARPRGRPSATASSVSAAVGSAVPTTLPRRMTVIRSATARTSRSLWVMKTIEVPGSLSWRMIAISSSVSCGVSTAVGSSRMSTFAWRESALMISTRCCTPTGRSSIRRRGRRGSRTGRRSRLTRRRASAGRSGRRRARARGRAPRSRRR